MREPTESEGFALRRAAAVLYQTNAGGSTGTAPSWRRLLAHELARIADALDAPQACESCMEPATTEDSEGVPLCAACVAELLENP